MGRSWFDTSVSADKWVQVLCQCGFACYDCGIAAGVIHLGPVMRVMDFDQSTGMTDHDLHMIAVCVQCQDTDPFRFQFSPLKLASVGGL